MAAEVIAENESTEERTNKKENVAIKSTIKNKTSSTFTIFDLTVLVLSVFSVISDLCTDLILVFQYSNQGYKAWAIGTFVLIFFPSIIVQFFSLRWHIVDKTASVLHWLLHFCMLGIVHRYFQIIKIGYIAYKTKNPSDIQKVYLDQSDLCMLHLFESFLESAPQLVLQMYVIAMLHEWRFWTGLSALASLLSLAWALASYTKAQRRARENKNSSSWLGLLLQAIWRTGMLTSRISTLVLAAYCFGNYVFILIAIHWIAMTVWIIYQKTDFCETYWEERIYNAVVGVIYCFCFFNLQDGQSRWRALAFYLIIVFQNLTCLTIFLMWFADKNPKLGVSGFIAIIGGTVLGAASMLVYYRFFHPSGPIKFVFGTEEIKNQNSLQPYSTLTLRTLKRNKNESQNDKNTHQNLDQSLKANTSTDSVVVIEENNSSDTDIEIKILQDWINEDCKKSAPKVEEVKPIEESNNKEDLHKRWAICSSVDLVKLLESKIDPCLRSVGTDEASSEILSAHDYENLAAVNIARETWGIRSWKGYSDIETWFHDDSTVHDRRLDTLTSTTSSDRSANTIHKESGRTRQDDYIDAIAEDLAQCVSETSSDDMLGQYCTESLPPVYSLGTLDPIFEEIEESSTSTEFTDIKIRNGSASTLVATIDEIRRNTPVQNHYRSEGLYDTFSPYEVKKQPQNWKRVTFASKLLTYLEDSLDLSPETTPKDEKVQETSVKENLPTAEVKESSKVPSLEEFKTNEVSNKENIPTVASKINYWNKILSGQGEKKSVEKNISPPKKKTVKKRTNSFLVKVLSPPNFPSLQRKKES